MIIQTLANSVLSRMEYGLLSTLLPNNLVMLLRKLLKQVLWLAERIYHRGIAEKVIWSVQKTNVLCLDSKTLIFKL